MRAFHEIEYTIYSNLLKSQFGTNTNRTISALAMGDLHYSNLIPQEKLDQIVKYSIDKRPDYIFLGGDIWESLDDVATEKDRMLLIKFLIDLGTIAPVLISLGSHDLWKATKNPGPKDPIGGFDYDNEFLKILKGLESKNIYVLDNRSYDDGTLFVTGYTQSFNYYYPNGAYRKTSKNPIIENKEVMVNELTELLSTTTIPTDEVAIILIHAISAYGFSKEVLNLIIKYLLGIGFHGHYGLFPPLADELTSFGKWGIISPERVFLPKNVRRTLRTNKDKIAVCGPLTMFSKSSHRDKYNRLYPVHTTRFNVTNDESFDTKRIHVKCKYIGFR